MVNRNLIRGLGIDEDTLDREIESAMGGETAEEHYWGGEDLALNSLVDGKILRVDDEFVLVDVGYKSEGLIPRNEWDEGETRPSPAMKIRVLIEDVEDVLGLGEEARGMIMLSKRKAERSKTGKR